MLNKAELIGRLGKDPEMFQTQTGKAIANLSIATSFKWKDKQTGEKKEDTEWHKVVMFEPLAKLAEQYLKKGSLVHIEGKLKTRKYEVDSQTRYSTEIVAHILMFLDTKKTAEEYSGDNPTNDQGGAQSDRQRSPHEDFDDDIPF